MLVFVVVMVAMVGLVRLLLFAVAVRVRPRVTAIRYICVV